MESETLFFLDPGSGEGQVPGVPGARPRGELFLPEGRDCELGSFSLARVRVQNPLSLNVRVIPPDRSPIEIQMITFEALTSSLAFGH